MNRDTLIALALLVDFVALQIYAFATAGLDGLVALFTEAGPFTWVAMADLLIMLILASVWMYRDARARGRSPTPWLVLTWTTGSIGPLAYVIARSRAANQAPAPVVGGPVEAV